ncbi:unnamed protein product [Psylliodes chrysocephalus]|uniref:Caspase-3 n=1 Tax=Psylliodes chrysocephalus TaxID=3402493 RepID=A0A9P0CZ53_9CUCU|nr:unnamed protein product [Psylliodes chrysocephala]
MTTQTDAVLFRVQTLKTPSPSSVVPATSQQRQFNFEKETTPIQAEKRFVERRNLRTDDVFEYKRNGDDPGLILIFNQETYEDETLGTRKGSRRDVNEIAVCFQRLGFNIDEHHHIMTDFKTAQIKETLKNVAARDLSKYNCLIVFFLSHGEEFNQIHTNDDLIRADQFWTEFKNNKGLANKPKMFVFQACKGDNYSTTGIQKTPSSSTSSVIAPSQTFNTNFLYPDLLIVYSSVEGNSSFRNSLTGSWFIQELCKNFSVYGKRDDVISLIIRTTKCVCGNYYHSINISEEPYKINNVNQKQMPFFVSTLKKKFYLNRNKDRDLLIRIAESNKEILKNLEQIKKQQKTLLDRLKMN